MRYASLFGIEKLLLGIVSLFVIEEDRKTENVRKGRIVAKFVTNENETTKPDCHGSINITLHKSKRQLTK